MKYKFSVNGENFEALFTCYASLAHFGDVELEIEEIICLDTGCEVDTDDVITPEIEEHMIAYFLDNYDPSE
jgi:hypothetical protein